MIGLVTLLAGLQAGCAAQEQARVTMESPREIVVLLHGLGRTRGSMRKLERRLAREGYGTRNIGYPSTRHDIETLTEQRIAPALADLAADPHVTMHFVGHSLGGILIRKYIRDHRPANLGRVVMLAPPNQGSEVVDKLGDWALFKFFLGPAGRELGTGPDSVPQQLGPADYEVGVIIGNKTWDFWLSRYHSGPSDGKVSVERARLSGMRDFLVVPMGHTFLMRRADIHYQILAFLKDGRFAR